MERGRFYFVTGGARSGKSGYAEQLATAMDRPVTYVATAQALDAEMAERIARHRQRRSVSWTTIEEPLAVAKLLERIGQQDQVILIDCLTLLITNLIYHDRLHPLGISRVGRQEGPGLASGPAPLGEQTGTHQRGCENAPSESDCDDAVDVLSSAAMNRIEDMVTAEVRRLAEVAYSCRARVILVSNETGLGLVPVSPEGRLFRDLAGWSNQVLAARADRALMLISGLAIDLKLLHCDPRQAI